MLMRLALGGAIIGREALKSRYQVQQSEAHVPAAELNDVTPIDSDLDQARFALVGAIAESSDALSKGITRFIRASDRNYSKLTSALQPVTDSGLLKPFRRRYQRYLDRGNQVVSGWVAAGRREEYLGRRLAQDAATETIEETLDYLADSPELDELMEQQSVDLVDDIFLEDIRENATNTSLILSEWFSTVILRRKRKIETQPSPVTAPENSREKQETEKT
jgi:hypothetical protein